MRFPIKTTKFPYVFWSFNKAYQCEVDFNKKRYMNLDCKTEYEFKAFNFYSFLLLKYLPIVFIFYLTFSVYDFYPNKNTLSAYILALSLALVINLLENLARKIGIFLLIIFIFFVSYLIKDLYLIAYVFKYFILLSTCILFYLDTKLKPFSLMKNNKIIAHFLIPETLLKDKQ